MSDPDQMPTRPSPTGPLPGTPLGAVAMADQVLVEGLYLPPLEALPQINISDPVHRQTCRSRAAGAPVALMVDQVSVAGLYRQPLLRVKLMPSELPPQTNISVPDHTLRCRDLADGAPVVLTWVQVSVAGSYRAPLFRVETDGLSGVFQRCPPQMIICVPVHTAVWANRACGAPAMEIGDQTPLEGLYRAPRLIA